MNGNDPARLLALIAALVAPLTALIRRRVIGRSGIWLGLLWIGIIGTVWLIASIAPKLLHSFT